MPIIHLYESSKMLARETFMSILFGTLSYKKLKCTIICNSRYASEMPSGFWPVNERYTIIWTSDTWQHKRSMENKMTDFIEIGANPRETIQT